MRRTLADAGVAGVIETRRPGYVLAVVRDWVDVHRFSRLSAEARRITGNAELEDAVAMFRDARWGCGPVSRSLGLKMSRSFTGSRRGCWRNGWT